MAQGQDHPILQPGVNRWRIKPARRVAFLADGEDYFSTVREVILQPAIRSSCSAGTFTAAWRWYATEATLDSHENWAHCRIRWHGSMEWKSIYWLGLRLVDENADQMVLVWACFPVYLPSPCLPTA